MKFNALIFSILLAGSAPPVARAQNKPEPPVNRIIRLLEDPKSDQVLVAAHRGDWHNFPENSLEGILSAVKMGVDIVEIDLQMTSDGHLVLMHDKTVDRVTTAKGPVSSFTLDSLRKLGLKNGLGRVTRFRIPTLEEVMTAVKGKVLVNLDKGYDFIGASQRVLQKTGTLNQAIAKSENQLNKVLADNSIATLRQLHYMPIVNLEKPDAARVIGDFQQEFKPVGFELNFASDTSAMLNKFRLIRGRGSRVWVNSLWTSLNGGHEDDRAVSGDLAGSYDWIIARGATIIQTDRPEFLLAYLRKRGLHK
ncbi:glycerophosphodiester phosphodiesterase family protein [Hufsiella ginkgonis]|uniref:Glycerophosphodiester phosphodiesterase n=1 Tax=Hufsiella ginkgonis TaxID=2695274 RepID=A0A7K1Y0J8_9SPHI|nr:glycerophosphodiester phosphodiesterase family protein [Hufsiella ginkgonis]MXV16755.1 glycerophosphodiester phosphodiesterase [Hufsiella ginkgonis]